MLGKKADGGLTAVVIILIIIVFLGWLVNMGQRECSSNKECKDNQYCGSDFACHNIPVIEKVTTPTIIQRDYSSLKGPIAILGLAVIIGAVILKFKRNKKDQTSEPITREPIFEKQLFIKSPKKLSTDKKKLYLMLGAIGGALIICIFFLMIIVFL